MESLFYFERQEGQLCAQHCLNNLLQGKYFSAVELSEIACRLDQQEASILQGSTGSRPNGQGASQNMDDSGFFSLQVIEEALRVWNVQLTPYKQSKFYGTNDPLDAFAFLCNLDQHWFCLRRFALTWFQFDSMKPAPVQLSDLHLSLFVTQLLESGYYVWSVETPLPPCEADDVMVALMSD